MGERTCVVAGCPNRRKRAGGLCSTHYRHAVRAGELKRATIPCTVEGCENDIPEELSVSAGLCTKHAKRLQRTGTTDDPEPYPEVCELYYCDSPFFALGLCERHYKNQWQRDKTKLAQIARTFAPPDMCTCGRCGTDFPRAVYQGPKAVYCPTCKPAVKYENAARWWEAHRPKPQIEYTCKYCGCRFCHIVPDGRPRTICSGCLRHAKVVAAKTWAERYPDQARRKKAIYNGIRRARKRGAEAEPVDKFVVFERDGWMCGICSKPIDRQLRYPHPMSASLDHVVPLAVGPPQHTYANTAAAHLSCNVKKGARVSPEPVL